jgi:hypothetical protein
VEEKGEPTKKPGDEARIFWEWFREEDYSSSSGFNFSLMRAWSSSESLEMS